MLDRKTLSVLTPEDELEVLAGSQIFYVYLDDFVMTRTIENAKVTHVSKITGPVTIRFEDGSLVWFNDPVTISYDSKGELQ